MQRTPFPNALRLLGTAALALLLASACTAPPANGDARAPDASAQPVTKQPATRTPEPPEPVAPPRMSDPLPPTPVQRPPQAAGQPVVVDTSCSTNTDCTVKNVGNCCGAMPACVNVNSPTDPAAVQAECERKGMMSVCGFREISQCVCTQGQCTAADAPGL